MQHALDEAIAQEPHGASLRCQFSRTREWKPKSSPTTLLKHFWRFLSKQQPAPLSPLSPLHPIAQVIQNEIFRVAPFANATSETLSEMSVALAIPSWLIGTEIAYHITEAASKTFNRRFNIDTIPSATFTAAGYELCRVSHDAFECDGPGRVMTLEYDEDMTVASIIQFPVSWWAPNPVTFSVQKGLDTQSMTEWIDSFINAQHPDHIILAGSNIDNKKFANALTQPKVTTLFCEQPSRLPPNRVVAFGAALTAKVNIESQKDDFEEPSECMRIRCEADVIAGAPRLPKQPSWPAIWSLHPLPHEGFGHEEFGHAELYHGEI